MEIFSRAAPLPCRSWPCQRREFAVDAGRDGYSYEHFWRARYVSYVDDERSVDLDIGQHWRTEPLQFPLVANVSGKQNCSNALRGNLKTVINQFSINVVGIVAIVIVVVSITTKRLPISLQSMKAKAKLLSISIGTDAARACKKVGKLFGRRTSLDASGDGVTSAHALCQMHAASNTSNGCLKPLGITVPCFTGAVLLRKGWIFQNLKTKSIKRLRKGLRAVYQPTDNMASNEAYLREVFTLLGRYLSRSDQTVASGARSVAIERLAVMLAASTFDMYGRIVELLHYCPFGCCSSYEDGVSKMT